jgi:hypothetical protein
LLKKSCHPERSHFSAVKPPLTKRHSCMSQMRQRLRIDGNNAVGDQLLPGAGQPQEAGSGEVVSFFRTG